MKVLKVIVMTATVALTASSAAAEQEMAMTESWLPSLITETPEEGFMLAVVLSRRGVTTTQRDRAVLMPLRQAYAHNADSLMKASEVIAIHFQTVAAANDYWRDRPVAEE